MDAGHLSATTKDANDNIFPIAMAVMEQENKESWIWFLEIFVDVIGRLEQRWSSFLIGKRYASFVQLYLNGLLRLLN